ncbi:hypothetical protein LBR04_22820 [Levilactobacillus brevis]|uniref:hypothetical protein n=1 Tax=Levilactobacillus brevis TaxID=1580 RepID=UPI0011742508|nr:hypothetical protein [Levilactobacillus brevis]GEB75543.1 hypothetical protein LBR04_22820 [Levilactobacillus brevis]
MDKKNIFSLLAIIVTAIFSIFEATFQTRVIGLLIVIIMLLMLIYINLTDKSSKRK